jgi:hypothetical protein
MFIQYQAVPQGIPALEVIEQIPLIGRLYTDMPHKPHYGYQKGEPLHIGRKEVAIQKARLIQFNSPISIKYLVIDIDDNNALFSYLDKGLPPPHIIVENLVNGHCHYIYELVLPVLTSIKANLHPIRYFTNIQRQLNHEFDADVGFTHYICKNPLIVDDRQRVLYGQFPAYTLDDLAKYVDLDKVPPAKKLESFANGGRNCELFDGSRFWAYSQKESYAQIGFFSKAVLNYALEFNDANFQIPLGYNEVVNTARSVSEWTWKHYDGSHPRKEKSESLAELGKKGGKAKGRASRHKHPKAREMLNNGMSKVDVANRLKVTTRTLQNWGL